MSEVHVRAAVVPYEQKGSGRPLVLVHGTGPGAAITWDHLVDQFAVNNLVITPNLSGSEPARDDGGELSIDLLAEQVLSVIEAVDAGPADLVGFSLGAPTVAAAAACRPDLVRRLVLVAGIYRRDDPYLANLFRILLEIADHPTSFSRLLTLIGFSRDFLRALGPEGIDQMVANMPPTANILRQIRLDANLHVVNLLPTIEAQTLVIGCTHDATAPPENSREAHSLIPNSEYLELASGHVVVFEQPTEFVAAISGFLDRSATGSS